MRAFIAGIAVLLANMATVAGAGEPALTSKEALGEALFFDTDLSWNRSMACAPCHDPALGFVDPRDAGAGRAVSLGDDGQSLGDRNTPSAAYAQFSPMFHRNADGAFVGGQFWDGRETGLEGQAGGPPLNPIEMGMPSKMAVRDRLLEKPAYVAGFQQLYGADVLTDIDATYAALAESIAAFERTEVFAPFDSKYDRFLRGEVDLTPQEELGRVLFFSEQFTNCNQCHQLSNSPIDAQETFSNYEYHNIGVPVNQAARALNGVADDPAQRGKFKVPSLRNVAVTGPYMHNGVFADLRTVVLFYNQYNAKSQHRQINPETFRPWATPEVPDTLSLDILTDAPALDDRRIDALVAFLRTLTDARYQHLMPRRR